MNKTVIFIAVGAIVILILGATQFLPQRQGVSTIPIEATSTPEQVVSTTTAPMIATTTVSITKRPATNPLPIVNGDYIISWNFEGVYANSTELIAKANAEIKRITALLGKGQYSDTAIYVGIANQYDLLGDGKQEYDYLVRAVRADVNVTSGLPWHNLGVLMERLGAIQTARVAYEKSTLIQPESKQWQYSYLEFLTRRMKNNVADIEKAFAIAIKNLGQNADIIQLKTEWENS